MEPQGRREQWGTRAGFMLATLASAVGLGNIWRFSYVTGENGGAVFLLVYVLCVVAIGLPAMLAELALGGRIAVTVPIALAAALVGIPAALGTGAWREFRLLGRPPLEAMDHVAADLLLPVAAIALLLFVGWALPRREAMAAADVRSAGLARCWLGAVRYLAPTAIALMLVATAMASP